MSKEAPKGFIPTIIKYDDTQDGDENKSSYSKLEYVYYLLAKKSGIEMIDILKLDEDINSDIF